MKKFKIKKGFIMQRTGRKVTIFDGEESTLHTFNSTAYFIFEKIKAGADEAKICDLLAEKYQITPETARKDVREVIAEFISKGIISYN